MKTLSVYELNQIKGGINVSLVVGIVGALTFLIGIIDGYVNPLKCRKK